MGIWSCLTLNQNICLSTLVLSTLTGNGSPGGVIRLLWFFHITSYQRTFNCQGLTLGRPASAVLYPAYLFSIHSSSECQWTLYTEHVQSNCSPCEAHGLDIPWWCQHWLEDFRCFLVIRSSCFRLWFPLEVACSLQLIIHIALPQWVRELQKKSCVYDIQQLFFPLTSVSFFLFSFPQVLNPFIIYRKGQARITSGRNRKKILRASVLPVPHNEHQILWHLLWFLNMEQLMLTF